jgi:hypothetical protein
MSYELRTIDGEVTECECCGYLAPVDKFYEGPNRRLMYLCEVCSSTYLSQAVAYPQQCPDPTLYKSIGWIANRLLSEIRSIAVKETQE